MGAADQNLNHSRSWDKTKRREPSGEATNVGLTLLILKVAVLLEAGELLAVVVVILGNINLLLLQAHDLLGHLPLALLQARQLQRPQPRLLLHLQRDVRWCGCDWLPQQLPRHSMGVYILKMESFELVVSPKGSRGCSCIFSNRLYFSSYS